MPTPATNSTNQQTASAMRAAPAVPRAGSADVPPPRPGWRLLPARVVALCIVELQKIRHDRTELYTRAIQPALWLLIFGETFSRIQAIPTGDVPYLDYLAPGILAQSALFIAIFYGIQIIWERDAGVLAKLLVTPTPRAALVTGKSFAAGVRALSQAVAVMVLAALLGVTLTLNPLRWLGVVIVVMLGTAFFSCLSMTIAGLAMSRDRLMGIGQAITMPLFFGSNALYPISLMPDWLRVISHVNPLSYEVDALRSLLIGTPGNLPLDIAVLVLAAAVGITTASAVMSRLVR
ncbi:ABC transporter permease [Actinomadura sp. HBU206391]|uniref:ABC transporter permease n=1 Tax=Actinomadura sp. HBU206391 TaxID=2731692 RepID=UPI001C9BD73D|nr:ABC transporter permease [Actinomadura sp. HBU206391]